MPARLSLTKAQRDALLVLPDTGPALHAQRRRYRDHRPLSNPGNVITALAARAAGLDNRERNPRLKH
jgi:hypothetical protein